MFDQKKFEELMPRLCEHPSLRSEIEDEFGKEAAKILQDLKEGKPLAESTHESLFELVDYAFITNGKTILSLGWDGDSPGASGAIWIAELAGIYVVSSSDVDPEGPFESIEEALNCECFSTATANPELHSDTLSMNQLLEIAKNIIDWENQGEIRINSKRYVVERAHLVLKEEE